MIQLYTTNPFTNINYLIQTGPLWNPKDDPRRVIFRSVLLYNAVLDNVALYWTMQHCTMLYPEVSFRIMCDWPTHSSKPISHNHEENFDEGVLIPCYTLCCAIRVNPEKHLTGAEVVQS